MASEMGENEDHRSHVISSLNDLRSRGLISDFKIIVGRKRFKTHRLILAANSAYFKELFSGKGRPESQITMENIEPIVMQQCIEYMYTSKCTFEFESIPKVLEVARLFQIPYLEEDCWAMVARRLNPENSLFTLNLSKKMENHIAQEAAEKCIQDNLAIVMSLELFSSVTTEDLLRLIPNAEPNVYWKAVKIYCEGRENLFLKLAEHLDVSKFPFEFLLGSLLTDPITLFQWPKSGVFVVKAIFSDLSRLEENINTDNCFLLKMLACEPYVAGKINQNAIKIVVNFMARNLSGIVTRREFPHLSIGELLYLMRSAEVTSQEAKWEAIIKWIKSDPKFAMQRVPFFRELFCTIRPDKLSLSFLKEKISSEQLVKRDVVCMERLMGATIGIADRLQAMSVESDDPDTSYPSSGPPVDGHSILDAAKAYADHLAANSEALDDAEPGNNQYSENDGEADLFTNSISIRLPISIRENHTSVKMLWHSPEDSQSHRPLVQVTGFDPSHHFEKSPQPQAKFGSGDHHKPWTPGQPAGSDLNLANDSRFVAKKASAPTGVDATRPFEAQHSSPPTAPGLNLSYPPRLTGQPTGSGPSYAYNATSLRPPSGPGHFYDAKIQGNPTHVFQDHLFATPILASTARLGQSHTVVSYE